MYFDWHKMNWDNVSELKDHYYYLVTHKDFKTPIKAKWHEEFGGHWEIITSAGTGYSYEWSDDKPVIAWMEMPEIYKE